MSPAIRVAERLSRQDIVENRPLAHSLNVERVDLERWRVH
jgi:hypothetical protein